MASSRPAAVSAAAQKPYIYSAIVLTAAASRIIPHAPNFTPIGALALFAGASFDEDRVAYSVPIAAMLISDAVLGFHRDAFFVYLAFLSTVVIGRRLKSSGHGQKAAALAVASVLSSIIFYLLTNFSVWLTSGFYPHTAAGLVACYAMAIPFFRNTAAGGLFYSLALFGSSRIADRTILNPVAA